MNWKDRSMFTKLLSYSLPLLLLLSNSSGNSVPQWSGKSSDGQTGTLEKMIVANGNMTIDLDVNRLNAGTSTTQESRRQTLRFQVGPSSFFTILVFDNVLRGPRVGSIGLIPEDIASFPEALQASANQLIVEKTPSDEAFDLVVRDGKTGFVFFDIAGHQYEYDAATHAFGVKDGKVLVSADLAKKLGRSSDTGLDIGRVSIMTATYPIEVTTLVNGTVQSAVLPSKNTRSSSDPTAVPGPDVIVGDLPSVEQGGSSGTQVGLGVGTTSCNNGDQPLDWFALPQVDHPVIPQNLYRMSGGPNNNDHFEQIGQSWLKHAFTALEDNACGFGCNTSGCTTGSHLCVGCSDPYGASLNYSQTGFVLRCLAG